MNSHNLTRLAILSTIAALLLTAPARSAESPNPPVITGKVEGFADHPEAVRVLYSTRDGNTGFGRIVARSGIAPDGTYRLEILAADRDRNLGAWGNWIWAHAPGRSVGLARLSANGPIGPLRVGRPARAEFVVVDTDKQPIRGAKIEPRVLTAFAASVPDELAELIANETVTDENGYAVMTALHPEVIRTVIVSAPGFGRQQFGVKAVDGRIRAIMLRPTGSVKGRLTGEPAAIRKRTVAINIIDELNPSPYIGHTIVTTDDHGRFSATEIPSGRLFVNLVQDLTSPWYAASDPNLSLAAGETKELEIPLKRAIPVRGTVEDELDHRPLAGMAVCIYAADTPSVKTDADGRYAGFARPGAYLSIGMETLPRGQVHHDRVGVSVKIPGDAESFELPPIRLRPTRAVSGTVVDPAGRPVAGAQVAPTTLSGNPVDQLGVLTDAEGRFRLEGVPRSEPVHVMAIRRGGVAPAVEVPADSAEPVRLTLDAEKAVAMAGRVIDANGRPVAGARVHIELTWEQGPDFDNRHDPALPGADGELTTDAEGNFRTPKALEPAGMYAAFVEAGDAGYGRSLWLRASAESFGDIPLKTD